MTKFNVGDTVVIVEDAYPVKRGEVYRVKSTPIRAIIIENDGNEVVIPKGIVKIIEEFDPYFGYVVSTGYGDVTYVAHTFTQALRFCDDPEVTLIFRVDNRRNSENFREWNIKNGEFNSGVIGWLPVNNYTKTEGEYDAY